MDNQSDAAMDVDAQQALFAKIIYTLRESRKELLKRYAVDSEAALLEKIRAGEMAEHPAYEHYLSALIVEQTRMEVRAQATAQLSGTAASDIAPISVHLMLMEGIERQYGQRLAEPPRLAQDALLLSFDSGLMVEARYFSKDEYSIGWSWGEAEFRIDTAPVHMECATFPHHLHDDGGTVRADPASCPGTDCWRNFSRLIDRLLVNPLLEDQEASAQAHSPPQPQA